LFNLFKKIEKENKTLETHNRLIDIRIGRKYARGDNMNGNAYVCLNTTAEEVYNYTVKSSDDLKDVNREYFIEGYNLQKKELFDIIKKPVKPHH
jgi:hypothetical protein